MAGKPRDLTGKRYGKLIAVELTKHRKRDNSRAVGLRNKGRKRV